MFQSVKWIGCWMAFIQSFLGCVLFSVSGGGAFNISPKVFQVNRMGPCPENNEMLIKFDITDRALPERNKFSLNGTIFVSEKINGPIEVCGPDHHRSLILFGPIYLAVTHSYTTVHAGYDALRRFRINDHQRDLRSHEWEKHDVDRADWQHSPEIRLPIPKGRQKSRFKYVLYSIALGKQGTYVVNNATVDLTMVSRMPIDGYTWIIYLRFFKTKNRTKKSIFCARFEVAVTVAKEKVPHPHWTHSSNSLDSGCVEHSE